MVLDTWFISGGDMVTQTLNAVAAMVNHRTWGGLLYLAETLGILTCIMTYVKTYDLKGLFAWCFTFVCVTALLLTPKVTVVVNDLTRPDKINRVDNVPVGLATPLWLLTGIGHSAAIFYDDFFHLPDSVAYSKTGLMFGQKLMQESLTFHSHSPEINANFSEYVKNCVIPDIQLNHKYSLSQLLHTRDIYSLIFSKPSPLRGIYYQGWESENTEGARSQFMTCQQATVKLKALLNLDTTGSGSTLIFYARKLFPGRHDASVVLPHMLEGSYNYFMKASQSAADILKQNIMIAGLRKGFNAYAAAMNDPAGLNLITTEQSLAKMRLSHQASYHLASEMLPQLNTVLMLLCISLFPIMVLALFVREITTKVIINYLNIMGSLMLWPVMFAIFNHVYNFMMATTLNGENVTFSNLDRLTQTGSTTAGIAGWMMMSIPFLSFKLFTSLGQQIASAGSYLGNALAGATTADASAVASGNYNMANMQVENINGFKTDLNRSYKAGLSSQQTDNGAMISTTQSGQHIVDTTQAISKLPFSLDTSSMLDTSFSKALSSQHQESESYHQGLKSAINDTYNISTALSNQFSKQGSQDSRLSSEQRQAIEDIQRQSQQAKEAMSSNNSTSREDRTSTDSTDVAGFGFGAKGSLSVSKGSSNAKASAELDANARYNHEWRDTNTDSASKSNRTSDDIQTAKEFSASQSATVIKNMTDDEVSRISNSETRSLVRDLRASLNNTSENFAGFTASKTKEQRISEQANLTETERLSASHRLEQEFTQFAYSRLGEAEASHVLTDSGTPAVRAQREALVSEFSDRIADDIRHNHFATQAVVTSHYQGMQVSHDASQYNPVGFNQSAAQLETQADKGQIRQHQTIINPETGESNKVSLLEGAESNTGEYAKAIRAEKNSFGHNVAPTQDKIMANEKAINKEKSANLKRYEDKGGKSQ
ncbi:conjugal transfer mating-pair stabilization protein TraG [Arsenophonus nasoniae]|uniref:Conjugal transfer mating-pair stabilization protein TraG n=1 Tax=Arsenophonus nasoniae TaxID=638 RepID=A0AA95GQB2_9GAMM|nr:conjugal transfer mating-pair stabilization protein TraG [Arsenophonus nasoniae]WGM03363.1 conjugal transfer mating-pair stabilization protein TraG [Arsenophonus nasoniae]